jgi:hypothetical protein
MKISWAFLEVLHVNGLGEVNDAFVQTGIAKVLN